MVPQTDWHLPSAEGQKPLKSATKGKLGLVRPHAGPRRCYTSPKLFKGNPMRLLPILSGFILLSAAASAQPSGGPDQPPGGGYSPPPTAQEQGMPSSAQDQGPPPSAQEQGPPPGGRMKFGDRFRAANTTNDGRLTQDQARAGGLKGIARHFDQIDTDHKGYVTLQDIVTWRRSLRQMHHAQNPQPPAQ